MVVTRTNNATVVVIVALRFADAIPVKTAPHPYVHTLRRVQTAEVVEIYVIPSFAGIVTECFAVTHLNVMSAIRIVATVFAVGGAKGQIVRRGTATGAIVVFVTTLLILAIDVMNVTGKGLALPLVMTVPPIPVNVVGLTLIAGGTI